MRRAGPAGRRVSTTGTPWRSANATAARASAPSTATPPPTTSSGRRALRSSRRRRVERSRVGPRPRDAVQARREHRLREVERLGLDVLRQGQHHRARIGRVGEDPRDLRQRRDQLLGPDDPVEVPRDGAERVVDARREIPEVLDLLEHRVGRPAGERVTRQEQDGQPVRHRRPRRRHHVQGTWPDRRRHRHDLPTVHRLGVGDGGEGHALLRLAAPGRQPVADVVERGTQSQHVPMPEDREDAGEERHLGAVEQLGALGHHPSHERLGGGQPNGGCHAGASRGGEWLAAVVPPVRRPAPRRAPRPRPGQGSGLGGVRPAVLRAGRGHRPR